MKLIEASRFGGPDVLNLIERDTPEPEPGHLLVEVKAAGLNYADIMSRQGIYPRVSTTPFVPGLEIAGVVKAFGSGVEGFQVGDAVAAITPAGGGYATHAVIPAAMAIPLPNDFDPAIAVALLVQGITAQILLSQAAVKQGDTVLISAAGGGLGHIAVQLAKAHGARVIGLTSPTKLDVVRNLGADDVVDYQDADWVSAVEGLVGERGVATFLDSIGDLSTGVLPLLAKHAQWFIFGFRTGGQHTLPPEAVFTLVEKNISVRGFNLEGWLHLVPEALTALFKAVADGSLRIQVTKMPLGDAAKAHGLVEARSTSGKIILVP